MAETAFQKQYRQEFIAGFEQRQSLLRSCVTTETVIKGNTAEFLVADSGGATAVTRGANGMIPGRADNLTGKTVTLQEWHDLPKKTRFNIFAGQGDQRALMQQTCMSVINRKFDQDIIAELDTATIDTGAAQTANLLMIAKAKAALGYADVPTEEADNLFGLITPGFMAYMMQIKEFASAEYVDVKLFSGATRKMLRWYGINWIEHAHLTGSQTASEKCYLFHRSAIGHAVDKDGIQSPVGYNEEQDYSWARCTAYMGSKLLQNTGIVQMLHDGSAFALS
jgi:hypothetical protein